GRHGGRANQDRLGEPNRPRRQIQPAASHRRGTRITGELRRPIGYQGYPRAVSDAMHTVVLLQHGFSTWNQENRFTGWTDVDLAEQGRLEAAEAGRLLKEGGYVFDVAYTSVLKRAIRTLWIALDVLDQMWIPVEKSWRLNERHYGALQGLNKAETAAQHGEEQVKIWRRSYDVRPPALEPSDPRFPGHDRRYADLCDRELPRSECLKNTVDRFLPYWRDVIVPTIRE